MYCASSDRTIHNKQHLHNLITIYHYIILIMNPSEIVKRESLPPISMLRPLYHICRPFALASIDDNSCCLRHQPVYCTFFFFFLLRSCWIIQKDGKGF